MGESDLVDFALHMPIWECNILSMPRAATTSDAFNAVAEPRRREILNYLALQEGPVGDIVAVLGIRGSRPYRSTCRVLRDVGLVHVRRRGPPDVLPHECQKLDPAPP